MKLLNKVKKCIAVIMTGTVLISTVFCANAVFGNSDNISNNQIINEMLGKLYPYGVVAEKAYIQNDFESNIATDELKVSGTKDIGNAVGKYTNTAGVMYIKNFEEGTLQLRAADYIIKGNDEFKGTLLSANYPSVKLVTNQEYLMISREMKKTNKIISGYSEASDDAVVNFNDMNNGIIDVRQCSDRICTVNIDVTEYNRLQQGGLKIYKKDNQILLINVNNCELSVNWKGEKEVSVFRYNINGKSSAGNNDEINESIIWNFGDYAGRVNLSEVSGVFVATAAEVVVNSTGSGHIIAKSFKNPGGEWHCIIKDLEKETTTEAETTTTEAETTTTEAETTTTEAETTTTEAETTTTEAETTTTEAETTTTEAETTTTEAETTTTEAETTTTEAETTTTEAETTTTEAETTTTEAETTTTEAETTTTEAETTTTEAETTTTEAETTTTEAETTTTEAETTTTEAETTTTEVETTTTEAETTTTETETTTTEAETTTVDETSGVEIETEDIPLADRETMVNREETETFHTDKYDRIEIIDEDIPLNGGTPKTGDNSNAVIFIVAVVAAVGTLTAVMGKKKTSAEK